MKDRKFMSTNVDDIMIDMGKAAQIISFLHSGHRAMGWILD